MRTFALYIAECEFIRSMMRLRRAYRFDYSIRPSPDISLSEAKVKRWELKPVLMSQLVADWRKAYTLR